MKVEIIRTIDNGIETLGNLTVMDNDNILLTCLTLELPWKNNELGISCIPKGTYQARKVKATTAIPYEHISLMDVPHRSGICIHKANYVSQLKGCIAVGLDESDINKDGQMDITKSSDTFAKLMAIVPDKFEVEIK